MSKLVTVRDCIEHEFVISRNNTIKVVRTKQGVILVIYQIKNNYSRYDNKLFLNLNETRQLFTEVAQSKKDDFLVHEKLISENLCKNIKLTIGKWCGPSSPLVQIGVYWKKTGYETVPTRFKYSLFTKTEVDNFLNKRREIECAIEQIQQLGIILDNAYKYIGDVCSEMLTSTTNKDLSITKCLYALSYDNFDRYFKNILNTSSNSTSYHYSSKDVLDYIRKSCLADYLEFYSNNYEEIKDY